MNVHNVAPKWPKTGAFGVKQWSRIQNFDPNSRLLVPEHPSTQQIANRTNTKHFSRRLWGFFNKNLHSGLNLHTFRVTFKETSNLLHHAVVTCVFVTMGHVNWHHFTGLYNFVWKQFDKKAPFWPHISPKIVKPRMVFLQKRHWHKNVQLCLTTFYLGAVDG